ncbi:hypothetical protein [Pseudohoeflea suaedae]|uniref:hypothetical protein n=1 Tax=Pseudohoeflea suaedae TaxID=877384 RepID=UPI00187F86A9|nr:hypothetical protein [Pseudohoeflea suaedae]
MQPSPPDETTTAPVCQSSAAPHMGREARFRRLTFHDLRGTGITYARSFGVEIARIAEISGHSEAECDTIIRRFYLAGQDVQDAIRKGTIGE